MIGRVSVAGAVAYSLAAVVFTAVYAPLLVYAATITGIGTSVPTLLTGAGVVGGVVGAIRERPG